MLPRTLQISSALSSPFFFFFCMWQRTPKVSSSTSLTSDCKKAKIWLQKKNQKYVINVPCFCSRWNKSWCSLQSGTVQGERLYLSYLFGYCYQPPSLISRVFFSLTANNLIYLMIFLRLCSVYMRNQIHRTISSCGSWLLVVLFDCSLTINHESTHTSISFLTFLWLHTVVCA